MEKMDDKQLVGLCVDELCEKMGFVDRSKLLQSDLEHLSYLIEEKTKVVISLSTIKRVVNGKFERLPQVSTLDALTIFIGYSGWQDFKARKSQSGTEGAIRSKANSSAEGRKKRWPENYRYPVIVLSAILIFFVIFKIITGSAKQDVAFSVQKMVAEGVPKNVIFKYNIDNVDGDSFYIQPSWNPKKRIKINKHNYTQTETYYEPGYHTAKLICDNRILQKALVHIPTNDWVGYSKINFYDPYPEYFKAGTIIRDSVLGISLNGLKATNIETGKDRVYYYACFPDSLQIDSDNFSLTARIRMRPVKNTLCPWIISEVYSENSFFYFTGTIAGCTSESEAVFSEKHLNGKTNDLSAFGFDVMNWKQVQIFVRNRMARISVEGKEVFNTTYERPGGLIHGMGFGSNGLCEVDYVQLSDSSGNIIYRNDFVSTR